MCVTHHVYVTSIAVTRDPMSEYSGYCRVWFEHSPFLTYPPDTVWSFNAVLTLGQRLRRYANIKPALNHCVYWVSISPRFPVSHIQQQLHKSDEPHFRIRCQSWPGWLPPYAGHAHNELLYINHYLTPRLTSTTVYNVHHNMAQPWFKV